MDYFIFNFRRNEELKWGGFKEVWKYNEKSLEFSENAEKWCICNINHKTGKIEGTRSRFFFSGAVSKSRMWKVQWNFEFLPQSPWQKITSFIFGLIFLHEIKRNWKLNNSYF